MPIKVKLLNEKAKLPVRGSEEAAGLDLFTTESVDIPAGQRALLPTGVSIGLWRGVYGRIAPRSKLAARWGIDVLAGVVDSDYRGEIHVSLLNTSDDVVEIREGDKIAQFIVEMCVIDDVVQVENLDETGRGSSGITDAEMRLR